MLLITCFFAIVDNPYFTSLHNVVYFASQVLANLLRFVYTVFNAVTYFV